MIKDDFRGVEMLHPTVPNRHKYLNIDSSKRWEIAGVLHMVEGDPDPVVKNGKAVLFPGTKAQVFLYLSRRIMNAEWCYWPMELGVGGLVWMCRKT